jgi:hypothetical protein
VEHVYGNLGSEEQDLVPELQYAKLKILAADAAAKHSVELDITGRTKDQRKKIHLVVKSFPQLGRRNSCCMSSETEQTLHTPSDK